MSLSMFNPTLSSNRSQRPQFPASLGSVKMFFSSKVIYPVFALLSVACSGFASPIAAPIAEPNELIVKRTTDPVTSVVQTLSDSVLPLI